MIHGAIRVHCLLGALAISLAGCDAVPTLTFDARDAELDADGDAGRDGPADAQEAEASNAPDALDAQATTSPDAGCPDQPPAGTTACCHAIPCSGNCDAHCADCENRCSSGDVCCAKNNVSCHMLPFTCP